MLQRAADMFEKLLCPIDFSAGSQRAQRLAERIAREHDAELVVAHASYVPWTAYAGEYVIPSSALAEIVESSRAGLDDAVREARAAGVKRVSSEMLEGVPWSAIVDKLADKFDLCVLGTHGRTGLSRVLLGSVAEKVVRHAPCSVLVARPDAELAPFRNVLVPTDLSTFAAHALDVAATIVPPDGTLTLVHVVELPVGWTGDVVAPDIARELDGRASEALEGEARRIAAATSAKIVTRSRIGYPGAQVLAAIDDDRSDLVVMGSHGRTGIARALIGSVAEKVVRHARCPVLVARHR